MVTSYLGILVSLAASDLRILVSLAASDVRVLVSLAASDLGILVSEVPRSSTRDGRVRGLLPFLLHNIPEEVEGVKRLEHSLIWNC